MTPSCHCPSLLMQRSGKSKTPSTGGGGGGGKRQRRGKGAADYTSGQETEEEDEEAFLASVGASVGRCAVLRRCQMASTEGTAQHRSHLLPAPVPTRQPTCSTGSGADWHLLLPLPASLPAGAAAGGGDRLRAQPPTPAGKPMGGWLDWLQQGTQNLHHICSNVGRRRQ